MDTELSITKLLLSRFEKYFLAEVKFFFFPPFLMTRESEFEIFTTRPSLLRLEYLNLKVHGLTINECRLQRKKSQTYSNSGFRNQVGQGAVVSHFEIIGGRRVLCEFKVSAGPCTRAKVANDSLGV